MFSEGNLLYFQSFIFPDGGKPKNKYFLVINRCGNNTIVALPTSKDHLPSDAFLEKGIFEDKSRAISAYKFKAGESVCKEGFSFSVDTFLYGEALHEYDCNFFEQQMREGLIDITLCGQLLPEIYNDIREFIRNSCKVRIRFKRMI